MSEHTFRFELGKEAKDKVSGFTGIITSRIQFLTGCDQYGLKAKIKPDGTPIDVAYFDEGRIVILGDGLTEDDVKAPKNGCDNHPDAPTHGK